MSKNKGVLDQTIPDERWWFSEWSEFEDFVGIGKERVEKLAKFLKEQTTTSPYIINRLLKANGLPHGPTNTSEGISKKIRYVRQITLL